MTVKVIIERSMNPENVEKAVDILTDLRTKAMRQRGYISGETLFSVDRPGTHVVVSTWENLSSWKAWVNNPERTEIASKIDTLLSSPSKHTTYETARFVAEGA